MPTDEDLSMVLEQEDRLRNALLNETNGIGSAEEIDTIAENNLTRHTKCSCSPNSGLLRFWDFVMGSFLVINFILALLVIAFSDQIYPGWGWPLYSIFRIAVHAVDIGVNCRVTFHAPNSAINIEASPNKVTKRVTLNRDADAFLSSAKKRRRKSSTRDMKGGSSWTGGSEISHSHHEKQSGGFVLITDPWEMFLEYKSRGWLLVDIFIAVMPSELIYSLVFLKTDQPELHPSVSTSFVYFFFTLVLPVVLKNFKLIMESRIQHNNAVTSSKLFLGVKEVRAGVARIFILLFMVLGFAHVAGCVFYSIARFEEEYAMACYPNCPTSHEESDGLRGSISWVYELEMQDSVFAKRYIASLYWALVTITSTGYGDVLAVTVPERAYNCIVTLFGALIYATIFGRVTVMFNTMAQSKDIYRRRLAQVNRFMSVYDLPVHMRKRIRRQVKFDWALTSGVNVDDVIQQLPYSMQVEVRREILQESLLQIPVMKHVSSATITALCMFFQIRQCRAGSVIIQEGDPATEMYFVKSGSLSVVINGTRIFKLGNGAIFGEAGLLFGQARTATIIADTRCVYFALAGDAYAQMQSIHPEFHELLVSRARLRLETNSVPGGGGGGGGGQSEVETKKEQISEGSDGKDGNDAKDNTNLDGTCTIMSELKSIQLTLDRILKERERERDAMQWRAWKRAR